MIQIQQRALRAFAEDMVLRLRVRHELDQVHDHGPKALDVGGQIGARLGVEPIERLRLFDVRDPDAVARCLHGVRYANAAPGGPQRLGPLLVLLAVDLPVGRQHEVRPVGDEHAALPANALLGERIELAEQRLRVDHHPAAQDDGRVLVEDAGGHQVELVGLLAFDDRVPGVRPAGVAYDHARLFGEVVDDLALPFVAPLGADHHYVHAASYRE